MALCGHSEPWLETWPAWGMAVGGAVFALPTPVLLTDGSACSSLPTLPTPTAVSRDRSPEELHDRWVAGSRGSRGPNLDDLPFLPTPTASMATGAGTSGRDGGPNLQTAVSLLPTPQATSIESTPDVWEMRARRHAATGVNLQRSLSAEAVGIVTRLVDLSTAARPSSTSVPTPEPSDDGSLC